MFINSSNFPELTDIVTTLAVFVCAGVSVWGGGVGGYRGVGGVGGGRTPAGKREHAADSEARGAGAWWGSSERVTLRGRVASPIEIIGAATGRIWEPHDVENPLAGDGVE